MERLVAGARGGRWLDAGCGRRSFPGWRAKEAASLRESGTACFGCDADVGALRERDDSMTVCAAELERLPFRDCSFDFVTSNMVFEHLNDPEHAVAELVRVTARRGRILVHTVNGWHYLALLAKFTPLSFHHWIVSRVEGRLEKDVYPTRYRANTEARLISLFEAHGCRLTAGGTIEDIPFHLPRAGLFWVSMATGVLERKLGRLPLMRTVLRPNLLMEFERSGV